MKGQRVRAPALGAVGLEFSRQQIAHRSIGDLAVALAGRG